MKKPLIQIKKLKKSYVIGGEPVMILKWINLEVEKGDFVAIMWPSWSGKTTLMNMIGILDTLSSGEYLFEGESVASLSDDEQADFRRDKIWFIFQWYNLLPRIPARSQIILPLNYKGQSYDKKYRKALELLKKLWLNGRENHRPDMLSGGEQQSVCIARALACDPDLLLADEPTGALDSKTGKDLLKLFCKLNKEGKTIIMITHDKEVASYAKKIIHLKDGLIHKNAK